MSPTPTTAPTTAPRRGTVTTGAVSRVCVPRDTGPYWIDMLHRIGVVPVRDTLDPSAGVAFLPPDSALPDTEVRRLHSCGLALVGDARLGAALHGGRTGLTRPDWVRGTGELFAGCEQIRIAAPVRTHDGVLAAIHRDRAAPWITLPLPGATAALGAAPALREFPVPGDRMVAEIVSGCDHGGLRRLVHNALRAALRLQDRRLTRLASHPRDHSGALAVRVDADDFDAAATQAVLESLARAGLRATWFIDVERHQRKGGAAAVRRIVEQGHEVQSHFYRHYTYRSAGRNRRNLRRSVQVLRDWGVAATAAAAPFGSFHRGLQSALASESMQWSSEFSAVYDDEPTWLFGRAQVPVHPVCPILLLEAGLDRDSVHSYYTDRLETGLRNRESVVFYGHPIRDLAAVPGLFGALRTVLDAHGAASGAPVWQPTMGEFKTLHEKRRRQLEGATPDDGVAPLISDPTEPMPSCSSLPDTCEPWAPGSARRLARTQRRIRWLRGLRELRRLWRDECRRP